MIIKYIKQQLGIEKCHYKSDTTMLKMMFKWTYDFENDRSKFKDLLSSYNEKIIKIKIIDS